MQLVWLLINLLFWLLVGYAAVRVLTMFVFSTQGTTQLRVRVMQRIILVRARAARHCGRRASPRTRRPLSTRHSHALQENFYKYLATKVTSYEERAYDARNTVVRVTWEDPSRAALKRT